MERAIDGQQRLSRTQREQTVVLPPAIDALLASPIARLVIDPVRVISGLRFVDATAARGVLIDDPNAREGERFARAMGVTLAVDASEVARIPKSGPLIVVSNHPFGFLDAATVCWMLDRQRTDVRFIANRMLQSSSLARSRCFFVDAFGGDRAGNARALRDAMAWVAGGKCLAVFPAGEVMSTPPGSPGPVEAEWNPIIARIVEKTKATVLPIWVHGSNSAAFHAAGRVHPLLRTALLPSELRRRRGTSVQISIGPPIPKHSWARHAQCGRLAAFLRARAELAGTNTVDVRQRRCVHAATTCQPIAPPHDAWRLELSVVQPRQLVAHGALRVLAAHGRDIPQTLQEIGRLRERTFREVGEGSGKSIDLDTFDRDYWHLMLIDNDSDSIIGSYRIGVVDEVVRKRGTEGLYTHTLFEYSRALLDSIGPALELGRSFVVPEWQRESMPLHLLWRAIGEFILARPQIRCLFGPVSISNDFSTLSKQIMTAFLAANRLDVALAKFVRPRTPPRLMTLLRKPEILRAVAASVSDVDDLVDQLEDGARGMPPLLRHYLRLDAKVLAFNRDDSFGECIDALITIDVPQIQPRILQRYFGAGLDGYLARHGVARARVAG